MKYIQEYMHRIQQLEKIEMRKMLSVSDCVWLCLPGCVAAQTNAHSRRDGRFGFKVGQIGPQVGQIRDFFRSYFSTFGSMSQMY